MNPLRPCLQQIFHCLLIGGLLGAFYTRLTQAEQVALADDATVRPPSTGLLAEWRIDGTAYRHRVDLPRWLDPSRQIALIPTNISWRGWLLVDQPGHYQIALRTNGHVKLELDQVDRIVSESRHESRHETFELDLEQGLHPFCLTWRAGTPFMQVPLVDGLAWKGANCVVPLVHATRRCGCNLVGQWREIVAATAVRCLPWQSSRTRNRTDAEKPVEQTPSRMACRTPGISGVVSSPTRGRIKSCRRTGCLKKSIQREFTNA